MMTTAEIAAAATRIWELQTEVDTAIVLATMGTTVDADRQIIRERQAEEARKAFSDAVTAAKGTPVFDAYLDILRHRATL